jgi:hypothetical protein
MDLDMDSEDDDREEKERGRWSEKDKGRGSETERGHGSGEGNVRMSTRVGGNGDRREEERRVVGGGGGGKRGGSKGGGDVRRGFELSDTDGEMDGTDTPHNYGDRELEREKERERDAVPYINSISNGSNSAHRTYSYSESPFKILSKDAIMHMVSTAQYHIISHHLISCCF